MAAEPEAGEASLLRPWLCLQDRKGSPFPSSSVTLLPHGVCFFLLSPDNGNKRISSPVSRYGLWLRAGWGSAYTPSRPKTESGPLLSAHYSGKGDMFGFYLIQEWFHFIRSDKLEDFSLVYSGLL